LLIGTDVSNGWWLFMSLFSIVKQKYLCEERAGSQPSGRPRTGFATAGSRDPGASRPAATPLRTPVALMPIDVAGRSARRIHARVLVDIPRPFDGP
jgi:hypothetical protein